MVSGGSGFVSWINSFVRFFPFVRVRNILVDNALNSVYVYLLQPWKLILRWNSHILNRSDGNVR